MHLTSVIVSPYKSTTADWLIMLSKHKNGITMLADYQSRYMDKGTQLTPSIHPFNRLDITSYYSVGYKELPG